MVCINSCLIAVVLISGTIATMITSKTSPNFRKFDETLTLEQKKLYHKITMERLRIYTEGMILGLITGLFAVSLLPKKVSKVCVFVIVCLLINMTYYRMYPKSTYMVKHLKTPEQKEAWLAIYKEMKYRHLFGMILGFAGYIVLGMAL